MSKRIDPKKKFKKSIIIYCPGLDEKKYLEHLKNDRYPGIPIDIKPKMGKADKFNKVIKQIENEFDFKGINGLQIFYVNDMDAIVRQHKENTYETRKNRLLKKAGESVLFIESMPSIEFWFLVHFECRDRLYLTCDEVIHQLKHEGYLSDYDKKQDYTEKVYSKLRDRIDEAIKNSRMICSRQRVDNERYSYTLMHVLIEQLDRMMSSL